MENKMAKEEEENKIYLELGQVIELEAPADGKLHKKIFLIEYLDKNLIKLINENDYSIVELQINNGKLLNENIEKINIIPPIPTEKGYARQWGYTPNKWFKFYFGGENEVIVHGQIVNLEKDQITINTIQPIETTLYIDFAYKGIPLDLQLIKIIPREAPTSSRVDEEIVDSDEEELMELLDDEGEELDRYFNQDEIKKDLDEILIDLDDLEKTVSDETGELTEEKELDDKFKRFNINSQIENLSQSLLSLIPTNKRTVRVLNNIHKTIERFKELRLLCSSFDEKGYAIKKTYDEMSIKKPLISKLENLKNNLIWIIPITKNKKRIYDLDQDDTSMYEDIDSTTTGKILLEELSAFETVNKKNAISNEENKYNYYYKTIDKLYNPNISINPENYLEIPVNQNIESITENYVPLKTNVFGMDKKLLEKKSYLLDIPELKRAMKPTLIEAELISNKYIKGLTRFQLDNIDKFDFIGKIIPLTKPEKIIITGYIIFPNSIREYAKIKTKNISLLDKAHLNLYPLQQWKILKSLKKKETVYNVFSDTNREHQFRSQRVLLHDFKIFKQTVHRSKKIQTKQIYRNNFLNTIIPDAVETLTVVQEKLQNDFNIRIKYGLSIYQMLNYLEIYNITIDNINYDNYLLLERYCDNNISWYIKSNRKKILEYKNYQLTNKSYKINTWHNILESIYAKGSLGSKFISLQDLLKLYEINERGDDVILKLMKLDGGSLLMDLISYSNINLASSLNIDERIDDAIKEHEANILEDKYEEGEKEDCKPFVLAKRYVDIDEMKEDDNEVDLFFDKKYDDTRYGIMDMFKSDKDVLPAKELLNKISTHLIINVGISVSNAERDALSMIEKKKRVVDGDYAILDIGDFDYKYYIRRDNKWRLDDALNGKTIDEISFCNIQRKCLNINKNCVSIENSKNLIKKKLLKQLGERFEEDIIQDTDELKRILEKTIIKKRDKLIKLKEQKYFDLIKNDLYKIRLGESIAMEYMEPPKTYEYAIKILMDGNLVSKYNNIIKFVDHLCRVAYWSPGFGADEDEDTDVLVGEMKENIYWYYDKDIDYPIMPTFYYELAQAFFNGNYEKVLNRICDERGTASDDGGYIVDKESGYVIRALSFSEQEGYSDSGYKIVTKSALEKDFDINQYMNVKVVDDSFVFKTTSAIQIQKIVLALDKNLTVSTKNSHKFIIKLVNEIILEIKNTNKNKPEEKQRKKREKEDDRILLYSILSAYLISLQTNIPIIKSKEPFSNCTESFVGYPTINSSDYSSLNYIVCVALNMRQSAGIWSIMPRTSSKTLSSNIEKISTRIRGWINDLTIINRAIVKNKIKDRLDWEKTAIIKIPEMDESDLSDWDHFLPPLTPISIKKLSNISTSFESTLNREITSFSNTQFAYLWELKGKMLSYSFSMLENIQNVILNAPTILRTSNNVEFLENSCCNDNMASVYDYFLNKDNSIYRENDYVGNIYHIYNKYKQLIKPSTILSEVNTRLIYPVLSDEFSEETIYLAFIKYCKMYTGDILSENIKSLCGDNNIDITPFQTLEEKIKIMKKKSHNYSFESLQLLINQIHKKNTVNIILNDIPETPIRKFESILEENKNIDINLEMSPFDKPCIYNAEFLNLFKNLCDRFEMTHSDETDIMVSMLNSYMDESCLKMKTELEDFLEGKVIYTKIINFIDNYDIWKDFGINNYLLEDDEIGYNIYQFTINTIRNILNVFPTMIINSVKYDGIQPPKHWKLDKKGIGETKTTPGHASHTSSISEFISEEYNNKTYNFNNFHDDPILNDLLNLVIQKEKGDNVINFINNIPFFSKYNIGEINYRSIIDGDVLKRLSKMLFLCSITSYIDIFNTYNSSNLDDDIIKKKSEGGIIIHLQRRVAQLIETYVLHISDCKSNINLSATEIKEEVLRVKEEKKSALTRKFRDLSEIEREAENEQKKLKLGDWATGLTTKVYKYDEEQFRKETLERENDILINARSGNINRGDGNMDDGESDTLRNAYSANLSIENRINAEVYNLDGLGDDDDDWGDGDEMY